jgi:DNA-binding transcriptional ArsR family regulator
LAALAEPTRMRILDLLCERERSVGELVAEFEISQPAVSQHLKVLREAGLVASRTEAQRRVYRVEPGPLRQIDAWLEPYRKFWAQELDSLERHLDANPGKEQTGG